MNILFHCFFIFIFGIRASWGLIHKDLRKGTNPGDRVPVNVGSFSKDQQNTLAPFANDNSLSFDAQKKLLSVKPDDFQTELDLLQYLFYMETNNLWSFSLNPATEKAFLDAAQAQFPGEQNLLKVLQEIEETNLEKIIEVAEQEREKRICELMLNNPQGLKTANILVGKKTLQDVRDAVKQSAQDKEAAYESLIQERSQEFDAALQALRDLVKDEPLTPEWKFFWALVLGIVGTEYLGFDGGENICLNLQNLTAQLKKELFDLGKEKGFLKTDRDFGTPYNPGEILKNLLLKKPGSTVLLACGRKRAGIGDHMNTLREEVSGRGEKYKPWGRDCTVIHKKDTITIDADPRQDPDIIANTRNIKLWASLPNQSIGALYCEDGRALCPDSPTDQDKENLKKLLQVLQRKVCTKEITFSLFIPDDQIKKVLEDAGWTVKIEHHTTTTPNAP